MLTSRKEEESFSEALEESFPPRPAETRSVERKPDSRVKREVRRRSDTAVVSLDLDTSNIQQIDQKLEENIQRDEDGTFSCKLCGKAGVKLSRNMKNHIETHLEGLSFPCQHCGKTFRSRNNLNIHKFRHHRL